MLADRDGAKLVENWPSVSRQRIQTCDVADEASCETLISGTQSLLGGLDGVFHSAGVSDQVVDAVDADIDAWQHVIDVNLRGTFLICRAAGRVMVRRRSGSIVTVSSVNGLNGIPRRHAYGPAKAGVAQLARTLACEWGKFGVRVNALAPTYINTPMIERLVAEGKIDLVRLQRRTPLGRLGGVEDVARAASFLLSGASSYITGIVLPVDGGWMAYGGPGDVDTA